MIVKFKEIKTLFKNTGTANPLINSEGRCIGDLWMLTANGIFALLHQKINIKINRFLFSIFLESPLNKGGSKWDSKIDGCTFMDNINNKQNNNNTALN